MLMFLFLSPFMTYLQHRILLFVTRSLLVDVKLLVTKGKRNLY